MAKSSLLNNPLRLVIWVMPEQESLLSMLYHALRAPRRRYVIRILDETEVRESTTREIAREISSREQGVPKQRATGEPYRNVYNALSQTHLPSLASADIIIYDPDRQTVSPGPKLPIAVLLLKTNSLTVDLFSERDHEEDQQTED
jgi:hypothetical protein